MPISLRISRFQNMDLPKIQVLRRFTDHPASSDTRHHPQTVRSAPGTQVQLQQAQGRICMLHQGPNL